MGTLLDEIGMNFEWFDAIEGASLSPEAIASSVPSAVDSSLSKGELGCMLSHIIVWRTIVERGYHSALILEDDVHVSKETPSLIRALDKMTGAYIVKLETLLATVTVRRAPLMEVGSFGIHELLTNHGGAAGYVVSQEAARQLLDGVPSMRWAVDVELFDPERRSIKVPTIYQCLPASCVQDSAHQEKQLGIKSEIGAGRQDDHVYRKSLFALVKECLKRPLRPLHRRVYDLVLSRRGLRRVIVLYSND